MIEVRGLDFAYPGAAPALQALDFRLDAGEKVVLLGSNGAGKSTLLKLLDGLLFAAQGEVRYEGETLAKVRLRQRALRHRFRREVGLLFQRPEVMFFNPTVLDEIAYGPRQAALPEAEVLARVRRWADALGLSALLDRPPFRLSGGQQQRLGLACLLVLEPRLLLLDEPTAHLDPPSTGWLVDLLARLEATTLVSTHRLSLAPELGRRALLLAPDGRLLYDGPMAPLAKDHERLLAAGLLHRHGDGQFHAHDWD